MMVESLTGDIRPGQPNKHDFGKGLEVAVELQKVDFNIFRGGYADQVTRGFQPRPDAKPVRLAPPLDWDMDPLDDRNWRFQLHAWRMLGPIWTHFYGRDWAGLKREILPWIRDWYAFHVRDGKESAFGWYDMATGLRAQHLALILHLHGKGLMELSADEYSEVDELAVLHVEKLSDPDFLNKGNHGIFQLVGLRLLGIMLHGRPEVANEEAYSTREMLALLNSQFGPDGVHVENSPDYHSFVVGQFSRIRAALFPSIAGQIKERLREARAVTPWFTFPDGRIAAFGDSEGMGERFRSRPEPDLELSSKWGDRFLARDLSRGGYVSIRSDLDTQPVRSEMLVVKGQATTTVHAHADHLGFEFFFHGRRVLVDSGKFSYDKSKWRRYFTSDHAHNVVGLQGVTFSAYATRAADTGLTPIESDGKVFRFGGRVARGESFSHERRFSYRPGEWLELEDRIQAPEPALPKVFFHLAEDLDAEVTTDGVAILDDGHPVATLVYPASEFQVSLVRGREEAPVQGWLSPRYRKRVPGTVIELLGSTGLRSWTSRVQLHQPVPRNGLLRRDLPFGMVIPFHYHLSYDRSPPPWPDRIERRIMIEFFNGTPDEIDAALAREMARCGLSRQRSRPQDGGLIAYYTAEDGVRVNVRVRPADTARVREVGAEGTVYMAFIYPRIGTGDGR